MPEDPVLIKTIVTTDLAERIAAQYGVETINVLTGFKYIGETIGRLEAQGQAGRFIFGFEESLGYLTGRYVRDKDGVNAALSVCDMYAWYAAQGIPLWTRLNQLYAEYGFCLNTQHSYTFDGPSGPARMRAIMASLRNGVATLGKNRVVQVVDYAPGIDGLPRADVLRFALAGGASVGLGLWEGAAVTVGAGEGVTTAGASSHAM